jgi:hypothetical protein
MGSQYPEILRSTEMTVFAIDVPRMFAADDAGKYVVSLTLRVHPLGRPGVRLVQAITILSGR